jgi:hypothetical protein
MDAVLHGVARFASSCSADAFTSRIARGYLDVVEAMRQQSQTWRNSSPRTQGDLSWRSSNLSWWPRNRGWPSDVSLCWRSSFPSEFRTHSTDSIEGDIWQAGGEPNGLTLGISFDTKKQILLNTLHVARPDKQTSSELDRGLSITTHPLPAR